jgi:hypothetical protein
MTSVPAPPHTPLCRRDIRGLYASWSMEWRAFLDVMVGEHRDWSFPYPPGECGALWRAVVRCGALWCACVRLRRDAGMLAAQLVAVTVTVTVT